MTMKKQPGYKVLTEIEVAKLWMLCGCLLEIAEEDFPNQRLLRIGFKTNEIAGRYFPENKRKQLELVEKKIEEIICPDAEHTTN